MKRLCACGPEHDDLWEFIPVGPLDSVAALAGLFSGTNANDEWLSFVVRSPGATSLLGTVG